MTGCHSMAGRPAGWRHRRRWPGRKLGYSVQMLRMGRAVLVSTAVAWLAGSAGSAAQESAGIGARALGMAGAFTAVADDASAVYWNPAGSATGPFASVVAAWGTHDLAGADDDRSAPAVSGSGTLVALTVPVVGAGYYRLRDERLGPVFRQTASSGREEGRLGSAVTTDNFVVTLAQTLFEGLHAGVALKAIRGRVADAAWGGSVGGEADRQFELLEGQYGPANTRFDVDLGAIAEFRKVRLGVVARNLAEPSFQDAFGDEVAIERAVRVGGALLPRDGVVLALDAGLTTASRVDGRWRPLAAATEVWTRSRRFGVRGGVSVQTVDAVRPAASVGASALVWKGLSVDGHLTGGPEGAERGWSVGARFTY